MKPNSLSLSISALTLVFTPLSADSLPCRDTACNGEGIVSTKAIDTTENPATLSARGASTYPETTRSITPQERLGLLALLNRGSESELMKIHGVAEVKARIIIQSRPIFELEELFLLKGFGPRTVSKILAHGRKTVP